MPHGRPTPSRRVELDNARILTEQELVDFKVEESKMRQNSIGYIQDSSNNDVGVIFRSQESVHVGEAIENGFWDHSSNASRLDTGMKVYVTPSRNSPSFKAGLVIVGEAKSTMTDITEVEYEGKWSKIDLNKAETTLEKIKEALR